MATPLLGLALPTTGSLPNQWGNKVNDSITSLLDSAVAGTTVLSTDADVTLTTTLEEPNQARAAIIRWTAAGTVTRIITAPAQSKAYVVINSSSTQSIKLVGVGPTTGITIVAGEKCVAAWNGSDFVKVASSSAAAGTVTGVSFTGGIVSVGTANTTPAMTVTGTSGGIVYFSSTSTWASSALLGANALMIGGGAGAAPSTVSAITTDNTYLKLGSQIPLQFGNSSNANYVALRGPATPSANSTYILPAAFPTTSGYVLSSDTSGNLSWVASGGGGGGIVNSVAVASANGFAGASSGGSTPSLTLTTSITGVLKGNGTAISAAIANTDYQSPITLTTNGTSGAAAFNSSTNVLNIPNYATGGGSGVPSFSAGTTGFTPNTATTSAITLGGTLNVGSGGTGQTTVQTAMNAFAGAVTSGSYLRGNGTNVVMSAIQVGDVPTLNQDTTGTAANVTGTVAIAKGGTGQTAKTAAFDALSPMSAAGDIIYGGTSGTGTRLGVGTANQVLSVNSSGTNIQWATPAGGSKATSVALGTVYGQGGDDNSGTGPTSLGYQAGRFASTAQITAVGYQAAYLTTVGGNTAFGTQALRGQDGFNVTGINNTAIGQEAGKATTTGGGNCLVGYQAGVLVTTGSGDTLIGNLAGRYITTGGNNLCIGDSAGSDAVRTITTGSNEIVVGNNTCSAAYIKVSWTVTSDARDKTSFASVPHGLELINSLTPTTYRFRVSREDDTPTGPTRYGFKAQDILAAEGDNPIIIDNSDPENLKYNQDSMIAVLVNAIKELTARVKELEAKL